MKTRFLLGVLAFLSFQTFAQKLPAPASVQKTGYSAAKNITANNSRIRCSSVEANKRLQEQYPELESRDQFEGWLAQEIEKQAMQRGQNASTVYNIPVIVHVIHNGQAVGVGSNISQAQVNSQINILNQDFRRTNADAVNTPSLFTSVAADCEINFCLAQVDPNGVPLTEPGIDRINRNTKGWSAAPYYDTYIDGTIKPNSFWDPTRYMNIWVLDLDPMLLGYAQFPNSSGLSGLPSNSGIASTDGVVITYTGFGNTGSATAPYNKGRTTTHEVGHWLGLLHIWGDDGTSCSGTDYCADTPNQADENYGCPSFPQISCSNNGDMSMNYMDYTDDACMNLFTQNQKTRIQTVMSVSPRRASLNSSTVCNTSSGGAPVAAFTASPTTVCAGGTVTFTNQSTNSPTAYSWSFPGGTPSTSTSANPTVTYATAGTYNVTLTATNGTGTDSEVKTNYITVNTCSGGTCDTLINITAADTLTIYSSGWGYIGGHNDYGDVAKAEYYAYSGPAAQLNGAILGFGAATTNSTTTNIQVKVWADNGGTPGAQLYSQNVLLSSIVADVAAQNTTAVTFTSPVNITGPFYVGIEFAYAPGDTVGLITNRDGETMPGTAWEKWSDNTWHPFSELNTGWGLNLSLYVAPVLCTTSTGSAPVAQFTASPTTVCAGGTVTFTNQSTNSPTSYSWSFPGGTPSTSTSANPTVTYATAGTYNVTLTATNGTGTDSEVKTNYITVNTCTSSGCDTLFNITANDTLALFGSSGWGYISGHNDYSDIAKAEYFAYSGPTTQITGAILGFGAGATNSTTANVQVKVWADNAGVPGTQLYSQNLLLSTIEADVLAGNTTTVNFTSPVNITGSFYVGIEFAYASGDTVALITNRDGNTVPGTAWEKWSDNSWHPFSEVGTGWGMNVSLYVAPVLCAGSTGSAPVAQFTASPTTVCAGGTVTFTNQSTNSPTSYSWSFPGGTPSTSTSANPTVTYATAGTYAVSLTATNANGSDAEIKTNYITVNTAPTASFTTSGTGATYNFTNTSTGNPTTYAWTFGDGGTANTANASHTYTANGTYTVILIASNACGANTYTQQVTVTAISIDNELQGSIKTYPNPSNGNFTLEVSGVNAEEISYEMFDVQGKVILKDVLNLNQAQGQKEVSLQNVSSGTYILRLSANNQSTHHKLFIQK